MTMRPLIAIMLLSGGLARASRAQEGTPPPTKCYGFSFGAWNPPLDSRAAGHGPLPPPGSVPQAPQGRSWAADSGIGADDLLLFPPWWPAGIALRFSPARASGDTLRGVATALVADGRVRAPKAEVVGRPVPCGRRTS
jgi:hypothetical protein